MRRYVPPNGTAGLARSAVSGSEALALAAGEHDHEHVRLAADHGHVAHDGDPRSSSELAGRARDAGGPAPPTTSRAPCPAAAAPCGGPAQRGARTPRCSASSRASEVGDGGNEAGAVARAVVDVDDGVVQPADVGDDRQRAVAHRLHLGQPARLEPARHERGGRRRRTVVGQPLVVAPTNATRCGMRARRPRAARRPAPASPAPSTASCSGQPLEQGTSAGTSRSMPFCSTSRVTTMTAAGRRRSGEAELVAAAPRRAAALPAEVAGVVGRRQLRVGRPGPRPSVSIPLRMPTSALAAGPQHVVEPEAAVAVQDLPGVVRADRRRRRRPAGCPRRAGCSPPPLEGVAGGAGSRAASPGWSRPGRRGCGSTARSAVGRRGRPSAAGGVPVVEVQDVGPPSCRRARRRRRRSRRTAGRCRASRCRRAAGTGAAGRCRGTGRGERPDARDAPRRARAGPTHAGTSSIDVVSSSRSMPP